MKLSRKAFTLIELLVVVLIIGILAAVAVPQYQMAVEKSRTAEALSAIGSLRQAVDLFVLTQGYIDVELIGNPDGNGSHLLGIDMETGLNCRVEDGHKCSSQYFAYDANCLLSDRCFIKAWRCFKEDCSDWLRTHYMLQANKPATTNEWSYSCHFFDNKYESLCKSLQPLGYTTIDERNP